MHPGRMVLYSPMLVDSLYIGLRWENYLDADDTAEPPGASLGSRPPK